MSAFEIERVRGRRVWDSRGRPTVEAEVHLARGAVGRAMAPTGASTGSGEALDRRDGGTAFGGLDVMQAVTAVEGEIAAALRGVDVEDLEAVDRLLVALDGTEDKSHLGANACVAVSMAAAWAGAAAAGLPLWRWLAGEGPISLPAPEVQIFGGGAHAARRVDIQDFMVTAPGAAGFAEACARIAEVYRAAGLLMAEEGQLRGVADEGGLWPDFDTNEAALDMLARAIERAGLRAGEEAAIALDVAASEFGQGGCYRLALEDRVLDSEGMASLIGGWLACYPIVSVEDPLAEDDWEGFAAFTAAHGNHVQVVGDDLLVTSAQRVEEAVRRGAVNTLLIKPNQRGTLLEAKSAWDTARAAGFGGIVSARSGETEDVTIVHLAVGWRAPGLKVGSFARSERMAKWNEAIRIEEALARA
ncbi:MAG: phosphopyruvate hydratase [Alphaproteobacteria bacterium]|nr:phosphopyruvate hydratase [Alphaproteobacteria bacterium]